MEVFLSFDRDSTGLVQMCELDFILTGTDHLPLEKYGLSLIIISTDSIPCAQV